MTKVNIWFNRTFGSTYHIIQELKRNNNSFEFTFFGTHTNLNSVFLQACDFVENEPILNDVEYLNYALSFCKRNNIDIFLPGEFSASIISRNKEIFESIGIKIGVAFSSFYIDVLSSKSNTYEFLREHIPEHIPTYYVVNNSDEFLNIYNKFRFEKKIMCFKPNKGLGGLGFRIVDDSISEFKHLMSYPSHRNTFDYYYRILQNEGTFNSLILMEYMNGNEISIDCLATSGNVAFSVAKEKKGNLRVVKHDIQLHELCNKICKVLSLDYLFNVQFINGRNQHLYLMDLNPRPSGGLYYASKAGYSMISAAIYSILKGEIPYFPLLPEKTFIELEDSIEYKNIVGSQS